MIDDKERLTAARWILERNLAWVSTAEVKIAFVVAIDTAMLGGLAALFNGTVTKTSWAGLFTLLAVGTACVALVCSAIAMFPRIQGPNDSLVFFGRIAHLERAQYLERLTSATDAQLLEDFAGQIHRVAQIASAKHSLVSMAMASSFLSAIFWVPAVGLLARF